MNIIDRITKFRLTCDVGTRHFHCGHEYVEIGGMKWATMNIGATSPTESGLYFQWGDTQGYTALQVGSGYKNFTWASYKYCDGTSRVMTKYNATDGKKVLDAEDDAVTAAWGNGWRMPTLAEFKALGNAINVVLASNYQGSGVHGFVCTDKKDSSKVLFFPAAGYVDSCRSAHCISYGFYWGSSLSSFYRASYDLLFKSNSITWGCGYRYYGYPVRGVVDK